MNVDQLYQGRNVILYGCGEVGKIFYRLLEENNVEVTAFVDSNPDLVGEDFCGYRINRPSVLPGIMNENTVIQIASRYENEILGGVSKKRHFRRPDYSDRKPVFCCCPGISGVDLRLFKDGWLPACTDYKSMSGTVQILRPACLERTKKQSGAS